MDVPRTGAVLGGGLRDFPGDIIRAHERIGTANNKTHHFRYVARYHVWKEPLGVRLRTMAKGLSHKQIVDDSSLCECAGADYMLVFRKSGDNPVPVEHPVGLTRYAGERIMPPEIQAYRGHEGKQTENKYSHWIWRQYASAFWDDVRLGRVLPYKESRDPEDERHVHPLQLDVIERACVLWSNPGEVVLTPFMGVGSECYGAIINGRKAVGVELKPSFYQQALRNLTEAAKHADDIDPDIFTVAQTMITEGAVDG
jgi:hypothetical protein